MESTMYVNHFMDDQDTDPNQAFNFSSLKPMYKDSNRDREYAGYDMDHLLSKPKKQIPRAAMPLQKESMVKEGAKDAIDTIDLGRFPTGWFSIFFGSAVWLPRLKGYYNSPQKAAKEAKKFFEKMKAASKCKKISVLEDQPGRFYVQFVPTKGPRKGLLLEIYSGPRSFLSLNLEKTKKFCTNYTLSTKGNLMTLRKRCQQYVLKKRIAEDLIMWKESLKSKFLSGQQTPFERSEDDVMELIRSTNIARNMKQAGDTRNNSEQYFDEYRKKDWAKYISAGQKKREEKALYLTRQEYYDQYNVNHSLDSEYYKEKDAQESDAEGSDEEMEE